MKLSVLAMIVSGGLICTAAYAESQTTVTTSPTTTSTTTTTTTPNAMQPSTVTTAQPQAPTLAQKNKMDGDAFLAANRTKPGVTTTPTGLQYKIITQGSGSKPQKDDVVTVNYAGTLIDGTEFDSSYKRNQPISFKLNSVIPGWVEALQLMPAGSTWEIYIPSNLAYGELGAPPVIGPNQTLIFKVQLLSVDNQKS